MQQSGKAREQIASAGVGQVSAISDTNTDDPAQRVSSQVRSSLSDDSCLVPHRSRRGNTYKTKLSPANENPHESSSAGFHLLGAAHFHREQIYWSSVATIPPPPPYVTVPQARSLRYGPQRVQCFLGAADSESLTRSWDMKLIVPERSRESTRRP
jgi:hypothetical protein